MRRRKQRGAVLTLLNCSKLSLPVDSVERCLMMRFFQPIPPHTPNHRHWCFTNPILTTFSIVDHHHQVTLRHHLLHHGRLASLLRPAFCCAHCPAAFFSASVLKKHVQANHVQIGEDCGFYGAQGLHFTAHGPKCDFIHSLTTTHEDAHCSCSIAQFNNCEDHCLLKIQQ